jgi:hypothetical protein
MGHFTNDFNGLRFFLTNLVEYDTLLTMEVEFNIDGG